MLKKIDCVMLRVDDLEAAADYYINVFGLRKLRQDDTMIGLGLPETDAEIVLHTDPDIHDPVHYLVDDVLSAAAGLEAKGCAVVVPPFDIRIGKCAVLRDPFGITLSILDMSKGAR